MTASARHASFREIADLVDDTLRGARRDRVEAHLASGCGRCAGAVDRTRSLLGALAAGALPRPPAAVRRRASALFGAARRRETARAVREVLASLLVDQRLAPAATLRSGPGTGRRLLWTIPGAELVAAVSTLGGGSDVLGQVLPDEDGDDVPAPCGRVWLERDGTPGGEVELDDEGGFALRGVASGTFVLRGVVDGTAFRTPPFVVG
jgi:hypothetical protein